ncbi:MAG: DUF418 domain-containing protein [Homoserinimonas sp.]
MSTATPRIVGIDIARGLAVLGMFIAHTYPQVGQEELVVDGRSSILFATLAGVSLGLLTGGEHPESSSPAAARRGVAIRATFLFLLGVPLALLPSHIAIILDYYGIMFALMIPALFLPRVVLAGLAAFFAVAAPIAAAWVAAAGEQSGWTEVAVQYLLLGSYPTLVWLPFLLVGLLCTRSGLTRAVTQRWMVIGGVAAMVVGYGAAFALPSVSAEAHSGSTAEVIGSGGFAIALVGVLLWTARFRPSRLALYPIAATGSMPLTIYTLQILLLTGCVVFSEAPWALDYPGLPLMVGLIVCSLAFSMVWLRFIGAGPLERLLRYLAGFDRTAVNGTRTTASRGR